MSERLARWIASFCQVPDGEHKGERVALNDDQRLLLKLLFDGQPTPQLVTGPLGAYLLACCLCGPTMGDAHLQFSVSDEMLWDACGSQLKACLNRDERGHIYYAQRWPILAG